MFRELDSGIITPRSRYRPIALSICARGVFLVPPATKLEAR